MTDNPVKAMVPVTQGDVEVLARIHEESGNLAAAFTLRQVGPTGCVLELQAQLLARHRTRSTTDKDARIAELEAALEFYADVRTYRHPPTGGLAVRAKPIFCDLGDRARQALKGQSK